MRYKIIVEIQNRLLKPILRLYSLIEIFRRKLLISNVLFIGKLQKCIQKIEFQKTLRKITKYSIFATNDIVHPKMTKYRRFIPQKLIQTLLLELCNFLFLILIKIEYFVWKVEKSKVATKITIFFDKLS